MTHTAGVTCRLPSGVLLCSRSPGLCLGLSGHLYTLFFGVGKWFIKGWMFHLHQVDLCHSLPTDRVCRFLKSRSV